jgi:hypothetical protein
MEEATPILVLGSGQRCGSTLVQRLLSSHPEVLIWGEHGGHLREILRVVDVMRAWDQGLAPPAREAFEHGGHQSWMANLLPGPEAVVGATRAFVRTLFAAPAASLGRPRWGFKEVRFGLEEATALRTLFPDLRVVHITRDPRAMLSSLDAWERQRGWWRREFTEQAVRDWVRINESVLDGDGAPGWVESWRYEDVLADPDRFSHAVARLLDLEPAHLDRTVFDRRISGYQEGDRPDPRPFAELPRDLRALIDDDRIRRVGAAYGYGLDG